MASEKQAKARTSLISFIVARSLLSGTVGFLHLDEGGIVTVLLQRFARPVQLLYARIGTDPHTVPDTFVGQGGRLYRGLHADQCQPRLEVVGVGRVLEGA